MDSLVNSRKIMKNYEKATTQELLKENLEELLEKSLDESTEKFENLSPRWWILWRNHGKNFRTNLCNYL